MLSHHNISNKHHRVAENNFINLAVESRL